LQVLLPEDCSAQTLINVHAALSVQSAIISSVVTPPGQIVIVWRTSLQWPFKISSLTTVISGFNVVYTPADVVCANGNGECTQDHTLTLTSTGPCSLNSVYRVDFQFACRTIPNCPLDADTNTGFANLTLLTSDYCAITSTQTALQSTLLSYADAAFSASKVAFLPGQRMYFKMVVTSPDAPIISVTPTEVYYDKNSVAQNIQIYSTASPGTIVTIVAGSSSAGTSSITAGVNFVVTVGTSGELYDVPADGIYNDLVVKVVATVQYATGARRRMLLTASSESAEAGTVVGVAGTQAAGNAMGAAAAGTSDTNTQAGTTRQTTVIATLIGVVGATLVGTIAVSMAYIVNKQRGTNLQANNVQADDEKKSTDDAEKSTDE